MDRDQLIKRLMTTFLGELEEHVRAINQDLLALEKEPTGPGRPEQLKALFRAAHSIKGAARSVDVSLLEETCHRLEEILSAVRDDQIPLTPDLFALLFKTTDAIEEAGMQLREQQDLSGSSLASLLPELESAATEPGSADRPKTSPQNRSPSPTEAVADKQVQEVKPEVTSSATPENSATDRSTKSPPIHPTTDVPVPAEPPSTKPVPAEASTESVAVGSNFVRVPAEKLDALMTSSGELLVARQRFESQAEGLASLREFVNRWRVECRALEKPLSQSHRKEGNRSEGSPLLRRTIASLTQVGDRLGRLERDLDRFSATMTSDGRLLNRAASRLNEEVHRVRMFPFAEACQGLERVVRDVAQSSGKRAELVIEGGDVEMDRSVLEGLKDPLVHLVRNAVDHGLEAPERRQAIGKPASGRITVSALLRGSRVEVVVADDGQGLDLEAVRQKSRKRGLSEPLNDLDLAQQIFQPGFSTASMVSPISGRGIGLDVVKTRLEALHGTIDLATEPGRGIRFTLAVPLTLTTLRALFVSVEGLALAFSTTNVVKLVHTNPKDFRSVGGRPMLVLGGAPLPVAALAQILGLKDRRQDPTDRDRGARPAVIVAAGERHMAFLVDEFLSEGEIVVKGLGPRLRRVRHVSGSTILPSGQIALVLNAAHLIRGGIGLGSGSASTRSANGATPKVRKRLLVADDSVTTRTLVESILKGAGYEVNVAVDGEDAWNRLQEQGADLLVSDVEMPRKDGFELTETIRRSERFRDLPVVLFTSRANERDRARGIEVGADAYIVKSAFDQKDLLQAVQQLL